MNYQQLDSALSVDNTVVNVGDVIDVIVLNFIIVVIVAAAVVVVVSR